MSRDITCRGDVDDSSAGFKPRSTAFVNEFTQISQHKLQKQQFMLKLHKTSFNKPREPRPDASRTRTKNIADNACKTLNSARPQEIHLISGTRTDDHSHEIVFARKPSIELMRHTRIFFTQFDHDRNPGPKP